jgi:hypothetical protein
MDQSSLAKEVPFAAHEPKDAILGSLALLASFAKLPAGSSGKPDQSESLSLPQAIAPRGLDWRCGGMKS